MRVSGRNIYYMNGADAAGGGGGSVDESKIIVKSATMPEASSDNAGKMYIYAGQTNANYTHGYIYENQYTATYSGTIAFSPAGISVSDENFSNFLNTWKQYLTTPTLVTNGTITYDGSSSLWQMVMKDANDQQIGTLQLYQQDYEDSGFTFPADPQDGDSYTFTTTITESSSSYQWVRIDVQPAGPTIPTPATYWYTGNTGTTITIVDTTDADCVEVFRNGILQRQGVAYTVSGTTLTLTDAVEATDEIAVKVNDLSSADLQAIEALLHNVNSGTN